MNEESRARVLVVDDSSVNRQLLGRILQNEQYDVILAGNGQEALAAFSAWSPPDIVLLDIVMPEMDGYQLLGMLKADSATRHIPVVMISSLDEIESVIRCIEAGAADYLPRPFNAAVLRARLSASLAEKRMRDIEREYFRQVQILTLAAEELEHGRFDPTRLQPVSARTDSLGNLSRVFERTAMEVRAREDRLRREVRELRIEIDDGRRGQQVASITGTEYFRSLRESAHELRRSLNAVDGPK